MSDSKKEKSPAPWLLAGAAALLVASALFGYYIARPDPEITVVEHLSPWWSGLGSVVSGFVAFYAAWLLRGTLRETREATELMRKQLRQNRAYVVIQSFSYSKPAVKSISSRPDFVTLSTVIINAGLSPALNIQGAMRAGVAAKGYEVLLNETPLFEDLPATLPPSDRMQLSVRLTADMIMDAIENHNGFTYTQAVASYTDIYGYQYVRESTILTKWRYTKDNHLLVVVREDLEPSGEPRHPSDPARNSEREIK